MRIIDLDGRSYLRCFRLGAGSHVFTPSFNALLLDPVILILLFYLRHQVLVILGLLLQLGGVGLYGRNLCLNRRHRRQGCLCLHLLVRTGII